MIRLMDWIKRYEMDVKEADAGDVVSIVPKSSKR